MKYATVNELAAGPKVALANASIDAAPLREDIYNTIDRLRRVNTPTSTFLVTYFQAAMDSAAKSVTIAQTHAEFKRIALALSLVTLGDL